MADILDVLAANAITPPTLRLIDVGAMICGDVPWESLVDRGVATLIGFEPQEEECARCNAAAGPGRTFLPEALGDGTARPFYRCQFAPTSSLYKPNFTFVDQFNGLGELMKVTGTSTVQTKRLDDIEEARGTDFLKLDVQGAELDILTHAKETLKHVSIVQAEVSFAPLYEDQPLFADVDTCLREQGFVFHTFKGFGSRMLKPFASESSPYAGLQQILWTDAVYAKPFGPSPEDLSPDILLKRAILFHTIYHSYDFTARALQAYDELTGQALLPAYGASLNAQQAA
jgi:FkbM family methyltransferase